MAARKSSTCKPASSFLSCTWPVATRGVSGACPRFLHNVRFGRYGWREDDGWREVARDLKMHGTSVAAGVTGVGLSGSFEQFKAVRKGTGSVSCCCGLNGNDRWQGCSSASGHPAGSISFELKRNNAYSVSL